MLQPTDVHPVIQRRLRAFYAELDLLLYRHGFALSGGRPIQVTASNEEDFHNPSKVLTIDIPALMLPLDTYRDPYSYYWFSKTITIATLVEAGILVLSANPTLELA